MIVSCICNVQSVHSGTDIPSRGSGILDVAGALQEVAGAFHYLS